MNPFILAIDQSTSGTKAFVADRAGRFIARSSAAHRQIYPAPGWVEHDPLEIYENVKRVAKEALRSAGVSPAQLAAVTMTNQRETAVLWDRETGLPVGNAIVWQCQRTADRCAELQAAGHGDTVHAKTGLPLDPYFSATKWSWLLEHTPEAGALLESGRLLAGTMDSWLLWKLTGGRVHATDYTNASRTSLFDIQALRWDEALCRIFGVPRPLLPEVKFSDEIFGVTEDPDLFAAKIPITGIIGDSQAALLGQRCLSPGMVKATYGTGTSVLMNIGERPVFSAGGLVTAIAWGLAGQITYALEAVIRTSGDGVKWVRDNLGLFGTFEEMDRLLAQAPDNEGVYLVPAFVGLGAPYWDPGARAAITGLSRSTGKAHIVRAAVESMAFQVRDALELLEAETGIRPQQLRADGGGSDNPVLMQFQASLLRLPVVKLQETELSALGSVYAGGLGIGLWPSITDIANQQDGCRRYSPEFPAEKWERYYHGWKRAVASTRTR